MARKDSRGYALKKGESQRKDGRYVFRYTTIRGEQKAVYAKELSELRKKEVKIRRAIEDGLDPDRAERITLNELFDEYISQKYDLKQSTLTNYKYMYNHYVRVDFGKRRISKIKYTDVKKFYYSLIMEKGFKPNSMEIVNTLLHPTFTMAVRDGLLRLNPTEGVMTEIKKSHSWEKKKRHALTIPEQKAFTNYIANSEEYRGWYPLFTVMLGTGCRIGDDDDLQLKDWGKLLGDAGFEMVKAEMSEVDNIEYIEAFSRNDFLHDCEKGIFKILEENLPKYMIPEEFYYFVNLPLSTNGKIDRNKILRSIEMQEDYFQNDVALTDSESRLAKIWKDILGAKNISKSISFFEAGGDSLLSTKLMMELRKEYNVEVALTDIFENPYLEQMASMLDKKIDAENAYVEGEI